MGTAACNPNSIKPNMKPLNAFPAAAPARPSEILPGWALNPMQPCKANFSWPDIKRRRRRSHTLPFGIRHATLFLVLLCHRRFCDLTAKRTDAKTIDRCLPNCQVWLVLRILHSQLERSGSLQMSKQKIRNCMLCLAEAPYDMKPSSIQKTESRGNLEVS
jgi:hypothetical protein